MKKNIKDKILLSFYQSKSNYEKLAQEMRRLFETDPSFPNGSIYTIKHRIKNEDRLIEKIDDRNKKKRKSVSPINVKNYQQRIEDLVGIRIVCLRLSDVEKVEKYLISLKEEGKLAFIRNPQKRKTFILPVNPTEGLPKDIDLQYSGYSSIHFVVKLGKTSNLPNDILSLLTEIQLRTVFEEAWGEIEHKYEYEIIRKGGKLPDHIQRGFYNLSAYLQAAALQAEYLCRDAEAIKVPKKHPLKKFIRVVSAPSAPPIPSNIEEVVKAKFGFVPTPRTVAYIERRMLDNNIYEDHAQILYNQLLTIETINNYKEIYGCIMNKEPFINTGDQDLDLLNAVNYALFRLVQPKDVAKKGLESVLRGRQRRF